jgi:polyisoprenyl-phosphate glycosyltransferase
MKLSVVSPVFNESESIDKFNQELIDFLENKDYQYEVIYVNDGSVDSTQSKLDLIASENKNIKILSLSRNFGKEYALTAGLEHASGDCIISIDSDGQHPIEMMDKFISEWKNGSKVVIGVRRKYKSETFIKKITSSIFYSLFNSLSKQKLLEGSTDFRLIDKVVLEEFKKLPENERITRGLIDWIGFKTSYIKFDANSRIGGKPTYDYKGLLKLGFNSLTSLTPAPLFLFGIVGVIITLLSLLLGVSILIEQILLADPLNWNFTGTAMLSIFILFLVGIILVSQGILSLYVAQIHTESKRRPLYIVDRENSIGFKEK